MDLEEIWNRALQKTEIHRARIPNLSSIETTKLSYLFLAESTVNIGDTVVRRGEILIRKPLIFLPKYHPFFEGFDFKKDYGVDDDSVITFLLMRGVQFPSLKYSHQAYTLDIFEGTLKEAIKQSKDHLEREENIYTGLVSGPEDAWQFSLLIYAASLAERSAPKDIRIFLEELRRKSNTEY